MASPSTSPSTERRSTDPRLAQLIVTLFALYARTEGNWLSTSAAVALMAHLGAEGQAVRSSISRLKRRGVLVSEKRDGEAGYVLAPGTLEILAEGDVRIFERARATLEDGWAIAVFSVPESEREKRHAIRVELTRLGFGTAAPGVWLAPATLVSEARQALTRLELSTYVDLWVGQYAVRAVLRAKVAEWWNFEELSTSYGEFLGQYRAAHRKVRAGDPSPEDAFRTYVPMLTQWRRLPYRDPGLPLELLPSNWKGESAAALFAELNTTLRPLARKHALSVIHGPRAERAPSRLQGTNVSR